MAKVIELTLNEGTENESVQKYELKFNQKRIIMIERAMGGKSLLGEIVKQEGVFALSTLIVLLTYGLKKEGTNGFVDPKKGAELAEEIIDILGCPKLIALVIEALQDDCGFLFRAD